MPTRPPDASAARDLAAALLDEAAAPREMHAVAGALHDALLAATWPEGVPSTREPLALPGGQALAPEDAARCLVDTRRTVAFARGVCAAIEEARRRFPGGPVEVLYAGCGPFATLALSALTRFAPDEARFTLLDVRAETLDAARAIVERLGLAAHVRDFVRADATRWRCARPPHVLVVEAMQAALRKEPQVAITRNLAPRLVHGGLLVPERVTVDAALLRFGGSRDGRWTIERGPLARLFDWNLESALAAAARRAASASQLARVELRVPELRPGAPGALGLLTAVQAYGPHGLAQGDSGLTTPVEAAELGRLAGGERIEARYVLGAEPGFRLRRLDG